MSTRTRFIAAGGLVTAALGVLALGVATGASDKAFVMFETLHECGDRYQAAKASDELNGQSWGEFFKLCHASVVAPNKIAQPAAPATAAAPSDPAAVAAAVTVAPTPAPAVAQPAAPPRLPALTAKTTVVAADRTAAIGASSRGWKPRQTEKPHQIEWKAHKSATLIKYQHPVDKRPAPAGQ